MTTLPINNTIEIDPDALGVEVSWSFGFGDAEAVTIKRSDFVDVLNAHGFQFKRTWRGLLDVGYLSECNPDTAIRKAKHMVKGRTKRLTITELRRPNTDTPRAFGVYKVHGVEGEVGDDIRMGARVRVQADTVVCLPPEGVDPVDADKDCMRVGEEFARIARSLIENVVNRDISDCLTAIGWSELGWVSRRRNSGGVYFAARCDTTTRFVTMLHAVKALTEAASEHRSHHFIPEVMEVYAKPLATNMWAAATRDQYHNQMEQLMCRLQEMHDKGVMRDKTIEAHADECDRLIEQAEAHRVFLESHADVIAAELATIRDAFKQKLDAATAGANAAFDAVAATPTKKRTGRARKAAPTPAPAPAPAPAKTGADAILETSADDIFGA